MIWHDVCPMKLQTYDILTIALAIMIICGIDCILTSLYWQHLAVVHNAACFEADSWGRVSFHWNDVSFAQTPFKN
jgi:hypothetical protein